MIETWLTSAVKLGVLEPASSGQSMDCCFSICFIFQLRRMPIGPQQEQVGEEGRASHSIMLVGFWKPVIHIKRILTFLQYLFTYIYMSWLSNEDITGMVVAAKLSYLKVWNQTSAGVFLFTKEGIILCMLFLPFCDCYRTGEKWQEYGEREKGDDMQQRATKWNQTLGHEVRTQPLYMRCTLYQLSHWGAPQKQVF